MYIIIVGGGKVGWGVARDLIKVGHEVCVIDREPQTAWAINDELGEVALLGDGTEVRVQRAAGMNRADVVVAATGRDQANLAVCQMAQQRFSTPSVIARINDPRNEAIFSAVGITATISVTRSILSSIEQEVDSKMFRLLELRSREFELVEIVIPADSAVLGRQVRHLGLPPRTVLTLILRPGGRPEVPGPDSVLEPNAVVLAVTEPEQEERLRTLLTGPRTTMREL